MLQSTTEGTRKLTVLVYFRVINVRTDRQIDRQTDRTNFTFMWGSLRLAPINVFTDACNESINMGNQLYYGEYI